jgi:predicted outer membrane lipoprotein
MIAWLLGVALAGEPAPLDALVTPLTDAIATHREGLDLGEDSPDIYHLRYHLISLEAVSLRAELGGLVYDEPSPFRRLAVEVRVGDPSFDNTGFFGWENGFSQAGLPLWATPRSVELAAWRLTDRAYKNAVEQYSRKKAQVRLPADHPGDYVLTGPVVHDAAPEATGDTDRLREAARRMSAVFRDRPGVERGYVAIGHEAGAHVIIDSEGSRVVRPQGETSVRAALELRLADGHRLVDDRLWTVRHVDDLPDVDALEAEVRAMADGLVALADAPVLDEEIVGPVLFTDDAARAVFRYLLLPQLEGTPPESPFDTFLGEIGEAQDTVRVGRRVLPPGWSVVDDPTADLDLPGSYRHDYEGTPARAVEIVQSGVVRNLLTSRVPRKETRESTGHARSAFDARAAARPAATTVEPPRRLSARKLHKAALKLAAPYGRDWYLRIDRLIEPAAVESFAFDLEEGRLPPPVRIVRVSADGSEQVLRGARFGSVDRWILRDIVAAGPSSAATYLMGVSPGSSPYGPTNGLPAWLRAPDVLVGEIEVLPAPPNRRDAPVLPHPAVRGDDQPASAP